MPQFLRSLLSSDFLPHGHCFFWRPDILWLNVMSDGLTAASYFTIPFGLAYLVRRRRDLVFDWMFWMFAAFIFACGTTHAFSIVTLWSPLYLLEAVIKAFTGIASAATAMALVPLLPKVLALPRAEQLKEAMAALELENQDRRRAEAEVRRLNAELERRVRERTADLERSNNELEQFAYVASHDLQEPLRMVATYTELLRRRYGGRLGADADTFIEHAVEGAQRMQNLIADLLAYSRADRNEEVRETDAREAAERAVANLSAAISESGATVEIADLPTVRADATQLSQLFLNLIGNAIKYRGPDAPRIRVSAELDGSMWKFAVTDNGTGIKPAYRERIFALFQRLHGREFAGTGMGLAICRKIVTHMGGRIWVESTEGRGSTFYFTIPNRAETDEPADA